MSNVVKAIQRIYPTTQGGFIFWETKPDGSPHKNPIDGLIWENTEFPKPTWAQIEAQLSIVGLEEAKTSKLAQLDKNRNDFCLMPIEYQGNAYATTINAWAAISYLANGLATLSTTVEYPNYPQGDNITLTKADFRAIAGLIQTKEMNSRDLRKAKIIEINACTTLDKINAINIDF
jgi:hypothetical protein